MRDDPIDLQSPDYTPGRLLTDAAAFLGVPNAAGLALVLEINQSVLTRVYKREKPVSASLMVRIMDRTGWHLHEVHKLAGMPYEGPPPPTIQGATR